MSPALHALLMEAGVSREHVDLAQMRAAINHTRIEQELVVGGMADEDQLFSAAARCLGLAFLPRIDADSIHATEALDVQLANPALVRITQIDGPSLLATVPDLAALDDLADRLLSTPDLSARLAITTPQAIRRAVWEAGAARRLDRVITGLFDRHPEASARIVVFGRQAFAAGICLATITAFWILYPGQTSIIAHLALSLFYALALVLRAAAIGFGLARAQFVPLPVTKRLPVYTVLVPVHREAAVIGQLMARLDMIDWPRSLLDIKIVCEADDVETLAAIERAIPGPHVEIVRVPPSMPRTKPKALCYALAGARGEFVAIYDAEDRPHPGQLREAWSIFSKSDQGLACLQAPLIIGNGGVHWLSSLFALEYAALFRGLLPLLARLGLPLPLGGTSNHFRKQALIRVGAWDPFNVTEDADLGMRLSHRGYRTGIIRLPTIEDAPEEAQVWIGQRTRWFKGWLQTWLVMMRRPLRRTREMGVGGAIAFHVTISGMLLSSLSHPVLIFTIGAGISTLLSVNELGGIDRFLLWLDLANVVGSYLVFAALGWISMVSVERKKLGNHMLMLPVYWLLMSWAAWRAVIELNARPFFWAKTEHKPTKRSP